MPKSPADLTLRHLAKVVESSDDAIVSKDLNSIIMSWNRAAERMFGYTAAEAIGQSIRMIIPDDRQDEEDEVLATIRAGRAITHFETIRQRKDGTLVPISLDRLADLRRRRARSSARRRSPATSPIASRRDLTFRRLAAVVDSSDDAIITKNLDSIITSWNPAAERMFGYTEAEAIGQSIRMLIPPTGRTRKTRCSPRSAPARRSITTRRSGSARTASLISISLTVSPIRNDAGAIVGASKIARDITEQVRLQAAAEEHATNTEKLGEVGALVASTLDREAIVQKVTDTATELTHAEFGAFFYNVRDPESGDAYMLYTLSGAPKEAFAKFPHPRATAIFAPTFHGEGMVRLDDVTQDPRYGKNAPYHGMPPGHLPVRSYLAVPVKGVSGRRARRAVLRPFPGRRLHRAARAAGGRHRRVGVGRARERAAVRRSAGSQPHEGRLSRRALARAAHAAQRDPRLRAPAARRHADRREGQPRPRDARAQRDRR